MSIPTEDLQTLLQAAALGDAALDAAPKGANLDRAQTQLRSIQLVLGRVARQIASETLTEADLASAAAEVKRLLRELRRQLAPLLPLGPLLSTDTTNILDAVEAWALSLAPDPPPAPPQGGDGGDLDGEA